MSNAAEKPSAAEKKRDAAFEKKSKKDLDRRLDEALEESFPGSDPVSISQPSPSPKDKSRG
jgi:hypothetical protein